MISEHITKQKFTALSLYFRGKYDLYFKYKGHMPHIKCRENEFWFISISKRLMEENAVEEFYVANFVYNYLENNKIETFGKNFNSKQCHVIYNDWLDFTKNGNLELYFEHTMKKIDNIANLLEVPEFEYPKIFDMYIQGLIKIEFIVILHKIIPNLFDKWLKEVNDPLLFPSFIDFCKKYEPFLHINKNVIKNILTENINKLTEK